MMHRGAFNRRSYPRAGRRIANSRISRLCKCQHIHSANHDKSKVIFSGIQPTGVPHLGNYLGALRQWKMLQDESSSSTALIFSVVDLHAITIRQDAAQLHARKRETLATLLAAGLDPDRCIMFYQSTVTEHAELMWILSCTASMGRLSRMTQWKSKIGSSSRSEPDLVKGGLKLGLLSYPVLQAADILLYKTTHVPVGEDQCQHLEFARECANGFNNDYGDVFVRPQTILSPSKRVMSLLDPNAKMSKSHPDKRSRIQIDDDRATIAAKIRVALTDSVSGISYDPINRPAVANLLEIWSQFDESKRSPGDLADEYRDTSFAILKQNIAADVGRGLHDIHDRYQAHTSRNNWQLEIDEVAEQGATKARMLAATTMAQVRTAIGL